MCSWKIIKIKKFFIRIHYQEWWYIHQERNKKSNSKLTKIKLAFFITSEEGAKSTKNTMINKAFQLGVTVVKESYLFDCVLEGKILDVEKYKLTGPSLSEIISNSEESEEEEEEEEEKKKEEPKKEKEIPRQIERKKPEKKKEEPQPPRQPPIVREKPVQVEVLKGDIKKDEKQEKEKLLMERLLGDFSCLYSKEKEKVPFSDVSFDVQGVTFYSCKGLLAIRSSYFAKLFEENKKNPIVITDTDPETFGYVLQYLCTSRVEFSSIDLTFKVASFAEKTNNTMLQEYSSYFLEKGVTKTINENRFGEALKFYDELVRRKTLFHLYSKIRDFVYSNFQSVIRDLSFYQISKEAMLEILNSNSLNIEEYELFEKLVSWASVQISKLEIKDQEPIIKYDGSGVHVSGNTIQIAPSLLREYLNDYLHLILFENMGQEVIFKVIETKKILSQDEILEIIKSNVLSGNQNYTLFGKTYQTRRKKRLFEKKQIKGPVHLNYTVKRDDIGNKYTFPEFELFHQIWFVCLQMDNHGRYLGIYLYNKGILNGDILTEPFSTKLDFILMNKDTAKKKSGSFIKQWKDVKAWGFSNFIEKSALYDSENGWFDKTGLLCFEVIIEKKDSF